MPQTMTIDRVGGLIARRITPSFSKEFVVNATPGGTAQATFNTVGVPGITIDGYSTAASSIQALREIALNPDWSWSYVQFPTRENDYDGYYHISNIDTHRPPGVGEYLFRISLAKIADRDEVRQAVNWTSASESASGFTSPSAVKMIALPNGAASPAFASASRAINGGSSAILIDPTRDIATFQMSSSPATWYAGECKVFDTETTGNLTETGWTRVFGAIHKFASDKVVDNGLIRYIVPKVPGTAVWYAWDNVSSPSTWNNVGHIIVYANGASVANIKQIEFMKITPDEIRWRELRQYGADPFLLTYSMRRGAYHYKCKLQTFSCDIDPGYVWMTSGSSTSPFNHIFNTSSSGHTASGNLPTQSVDNWHAANSTSQNWCAGFVLCDSPTQQPYDRAESNILDLSNIWGTSASRNFFGFVFAAPSACTLVGLRAMSASIAAQCMFNVEQSQILMKKGGYV